MAALPVRSHFIACPREAKREEHELVLHFGSPRSHIHHHQPLRSGSPLAANKVETFSDKDKQEWISGRVGSSRLGSGSLPQTLLLHPEDGEEQQQPCPDSPERLFAVEVTAEQLLEAEVPVEPCAEASQGKAPSELLPASRDAKHALSADVQQAAAQV